MSNNLCMRSAVVFVSTMRSACSTSTLSTAISNATLTVPALACFAVVMQIIRNSPENDLQPFFLLPTQLPRSGYVVTFSTRPNSSGNSLPPIWSVLHQASGTNRGWVTVKLLVSPCSKKKLAFISG